MNGTVVHTWKVIPHFNKRCRLLPNGHLLYVGPNETIFEYDWHGNIVWKYETEGYANLKFFSKTMGTQKRLPNGNTFIAEDNTGRLFQVKPDGDIVWEYVNRGGTCRPFPVSYDYCPQIKALPKPPEHAVTPPNNLEWHIKPDILRKKTK